MGSFVENLYFDKIKIFNKDDIQKNIKTANMIRQISELEEKLMECLNEEERNYLFAFMNAFTDLASVTASHVYNQGFRQGSQFTYNTLDHQDNQT